MGKLLYEDLTYQIRKGCFNIYNSLGFGHKEHVYQKALAKELNSLKLNFVEEPILKVKYKEEVVGTYKPDFVIEEKIIVELKAVEFLPKSFEIQLLYYLKSTNYQLGLLINFGSPKLSIKRLVWTSNHPWQSDPRQSASHPR
ncbi:hypothetical protein A3A74_04415 [Candidatus Roizmanbacteria bacterium RIFCSPLOWO2_01_FULL_35_13]|uniref:GxxExxY protein n=1 Tax=Candidatus Roizmanbacteria bacterium RIFCSPLOWO2_01_FULL_35_13 TaxID=1802055 RepID=A0A1F7I8L2_9BACT|nr:MAG: hypothetical protein A3A74_04415 [Candidatus Roizmanbacteria bacterium RIFCSPLOWO2_01_FULL_35_13]